MILSKKCSIDREIKRLAKLISDKKWSVASELISTISAPLGLALCEGESGSPYTGVWWSPISHNFATIIFSKNLPKDRAHFFVTRLVGSIDLLKAFHSSNYFLNRSIYLNLDDSADAPGLAFCSNRSDSVLIPDPDYLQSNGYVSLKAYFQAHTVAWESRSSKVFWRGSTTGVREAGSYLELPRIKLCELALSCKNSEYFDVGVSSLAQLSRHEAQEVKAAGFVRPYAPIEQSNQFKYLIDIDSNTNAWSGFFLKLLSGSVVLKVESPFGFKQWYYDQLIPGKHYVSVKPDMSDLLEKVDWLVLNDAKAREIGSYGSEFASQLNLESQLNEACMNIHKALL